MDSEKLDEQKRTKAYVDEAFRLIMEKPGVSDIIILNKAGSPVKTTMELPQAILISGYYESLCLKAASGIKKMDHLDEMLMLRVKTKDHEIIITPDGRITIMVIHNAPDMFQ